MIPNSARKALENAECVLTPLAEAMSATVTCVHRRLASRVRASSRRWLRIRSRTVVPDAWSTAWTKAFVQAFSEGLWAESQHTGVRITACCPAAVDTQYFRVLGGHEEAALGRPISPDRVVEAALAAVERGRMHTVIGLRWKVTVWSLRLFTRRRNALTYERLSRPQVRVAA